MKKSILSIALASSLSLAAGGALAQLSITGGVDFVTGDYGTGTDADTWTYTALVKYETGPLIFKANIPLYVDTEANREVGVVGATAGREKGFGDIVGSVFYNLLDPTKSAVGLDVGVKVKFVTADKDKTLITTGNEDYSLQVDAYQAFGPTTVFGSLGWTKKGDIRSRTGTGAFVESNPDDPFYGSFGLSFKLSDATSIGAAYDYREKLFSTSNEISEATVFLTQKLTPNLKAQLYGVGGLSDGSPDWGAGATLGYTF